MKEYIICIALLAAVVCPAFGQENVVTNWTIRDCRDPVFMAERLSTNFHWLFNTSWDTGAYTRAQSDARYAPTSAATVAAAAYSSATGAAAVAGAAVPAANATYTATVAKAASALQGASFAQVDTNATTTVTLYTPAFIGQSLIGAEDSSGRIWRATSTTTNGWTLKFNVD